MKTILQNGSRGQAKAETLDEDGLTVAQAARELKTTQRMVRHWLATGELEMVFTEDEHSRRVARHSVKALRAAHTPSHARRLANGIGAAQISTTAEEHAQLTVLTSCQPLIEVLDEIKDFRRRRGRRYALSSILALACSAMLCGCRTYEAIALWGRYYGSDILRDLGFSHARIPCALTFYLVFNGLNRTDFETRLGQWVGSIVEVLPGHREESIKTLLAVNAPPQATHNINHDGLANGDDAEQEAMGLHLLSPLSRRLGLPQRRDAPAIRPDDTGVINQIIAGLVLEGRVVVPTPQAGLTRRVIKG